MSEATKLTWAQMIEARAELRGELRDRRELLITLLSDVGGTLPESLTSEIRACEDLDRLLAGVRQVRMLTSLDQFKF